MQVLFPPVAAVLGDEGGIKTFFLLLPWPAGNALPNAAHDVAGCENALLAYGQLVVHQDPPGLYLVGPQCVLVRGVIPPQGQELILPFVGLHEAPLCPSGSLRMAVRPSDGSAAPSQL